MTVFVSGATTGIGGGTARAFAAARFEVALGDLNLDAVEQAPRDQSESLSGLSFAMTSVRRLR
jgi:NAD(P)-dependent dehydrogenase (short-subunit alcohol dehydrogenase family)